MVKLSYVGTGWTAWYNAKHSEWYRWTNMHVSEQDATLLTKEEAEKIIGISYLTNKQARAHDGGKIRFEIHEVQRYKQLLIDFQPQEAT